MRKGSVILILITILLGGCENTSDQFLSYQNVIPPIGYDSGNFLTENDYFAENLVIIPETEVGVSDDLLSSKAALLIDVTDNKTVYSKNVYDKLYPASLTKLMTALVVLKLGELTDSVTISFNASHIPDPAAKICGFEEGDVVSLEALLHSLLIYSGNDAGIAIAEHVGGSEEKFAKLMNQEAARIGAVHSNFVNSHGLHDENHYTTAYDMYLIFHELIRYDSFRSIINSSSYTATYADEDGKPKEKIFQSTNLYLIDKKDMPDNIEVIGGKSGTTYKAGNCLILLSKDINDHSYISLILKATDQEQLYNEMSQLLSGELLLSETN